MRNGRILLVEDEHNVGSTLAERLQMEKYNVTWAKTASQALEHHNHQKFDLVIMDVGLPDGNGFDLAKKMNHATFIFLTAFGAPEDRVKGLELGASDYVSKPFHLFLPLNFAPSRVRLQHRLIFHLFQKAQPVLHLIQKIRFRCQCSRL